MIKRTVEISQQAVHLTVRDRQLLLLKSHEATEPRSHEGEANEPPVWRRRGENPDIVAAIPCEDIGVLLVEHPGVTYSHAALTALLDSDAVVVVCGRDHLPAGLLLPLSQHTQVVWRVNDQLSISKPLRKQLWTQLIRAKIRAQAANLAPGTATRSKLLALAREVRSGDPSNIEAQAARAYWSAWRSSLATQGTTSDFLLQTSEFRRDPDGPPPNDLLNYGYAVVRAAIARAIVAAGLLPVLGLRHRNRSNAFCLADDLIEPLRPIVDARVRELVAQGETASSPAAKRGLLELLTAEVSTADQAGPLMVSLHRYVASLARCFGGEDRQLQIPVACGAPASDEP